MAEHTRAELIAWAKQRAHTERKYASAQRLEAIAAMLEADAEVRKAAEALVTNLTAFLVANIHGFETGVATPTFHHELAALRALLRGDA